MSLLFLLFVLFIILFMVKLIGSEMYSFPHVYLEHGFVRIAVERSLVIIPTMVLLTLQYTNNCSLLYRTLKRTRRIHSYCKDKSLHLFLCPSDINKYIKALR